MHCKHEHFVNELVRRFLAGALVAVVLAGCGRERIELTAIAEIPGLQIEALVVDGDFLYGSTPDDSLVIIDISNPEQPEIVGRLALGDGVGPTIEIAVRGDHAYLGRERSGLVTVDVSTPSQPVEVGGYASPNSIFDIVIRDQYAYAALPAQGLQIYDISIPETPVLVGELAAIGPAFGVALAGDFAFMAVDDVGMCVADISDPTAPRYVDTNGAPTGARQVRIWDPQRAFIMVSGLDPGLATVDISNPELTTLADFDSLGETRDLDLVDDTVYVLRSWMLTLLDAGSNSPEIVGEFQFPVDDMDAYSLAISGDHVFVGEGPGFIFGQGERLLVLKRQP